MPQSHNLPATTLRAIANLASDRLDHGTYQMMAAGASAALTETFEVWFLDRTAVARPYASLATLAHRTGYWHHQIHIDGQPAQYARSRPYGPGDEDWSLHAIARSELAANIDAGISQIDADRAYEDCYVRLLLTPSYFTSSLWLMFNDSRELVLPVMVPASYKYVTKSKFMIAHDFLAALGREKPAHGTPSPDAFSPPAAPSLTP